MILYQRQEHVCVHFIVVSIERTDYDSSNDPSTGFQKQHISASDHLLFNTNKRNVYSATQLEMFNLFCRYVCTAKRIFQWRRSPFYRERYDLTAYTADANARIRFISDLFPHMNETWNRSENIGIRAIFFPAYTVVGHVRSVPHGRKNIGIWSLEPCSVNAA